tara:strand:- start:32 stop:334 length:303 start_codon:yes stop_codon:yes gene_type:complete
VDNHPFPEDYMNVKTFIGTAAVALALAAPAFAVDVTNEQDTEVQLTVSDNDGSELINLAAGETIPNLCEKCKLVVGDESLNVEGDQVAVIRNGKISVRAN